MVIANYRVVAPMGLRNDILKTMGLILGPTRALKGCLECCVSIDAENKNVLRLEQWWSTMKAMESHIRSPEYGMLLSVLEMSNEPPVVCFYEVASEAGVELIERLRA
jgi:quinol monooxygenase YgiN